MRLEGLIMMIAMTLMVGCIVLISFFFLFLGLALLIAPVELAVESIDYFVSIFPSVAFRVIIPW